MRKFIKKYYPEILGILTFIAVLFIVPWLMGPATCRDGWESPSIGSRGACSYHGGVSNVSTDIGVVVGGITGFVTYVVLSDKRAERNKPEKLKKRKDIS